MIDLASWAAEYEVGVDAVVALRALLIQRGAMAPPVGHPVPESEAAVQAAIRLEAAEKGIQLWRNNVGVTFGPNGVPIRYGLANDTPAMNKRVKSSDLVGVRPGGQIVVREIKRPGWVYSGSPHEVAQLRFLELILGMGGDACFASSEGTL